MARKPAAVVKVSVSLPPEDEAWVRARAKRTGKPFSTIVKDCLSDARRDEARRDVLAWLLDGQAPLSRRELRDMAREIDGKAPRARRR